MFQYRQYLQQCKTFTSTSTCWEVGSEKLLGVGGGMNCIEWTINNLRLETGQEPVTSATTKLLRPFWDFGTLYGSIHNSSALFLSQEWQDWKFSPLHPGLTSLGGTEPLGSLSGQPCSQSTWKPLSGSRSGISGYTLTFCLWDNVLLFVCMCDGTYFDWLNYI